MKIVALFFILKFNLPRSLKSAHTVKLPFAIKAINKIITKDHQNASVIKQEYVFLLLYIYF
jgi:hypothetical protein